MMNKNKFSLLVGFLSLIVTYQAIFIVNRYKKIQSEKTVDELPMETRRIVEDQAEIDREEFTLKNNQQIDGAYVWFEKESNLNGLGNGTENVSIWIEAKIPVRIVDLKIDFNPNEISIFDADSNIPGVQIFYGQVSRYLVNTVSFEDGQINLACEFTDGFIGKKKLGIIKLLKNNQEINSKIKLVFTKASQEDSYVLPMDVTNSENILTGESEIEI